MKPSNERTICDNGKPYESAGRKAADEVCIISILIIKFLLILQIEQAIPH